MRRPSIAGAVTAAALLLAACGGGDGSVASGTTAPAEPSAPARDVASPSGPSQPDGVEVPAALDFVADDVRGGEVVGAELAGRELVIWFWAPW